MARPLLPTGPDPTFDSRVEDIARRLVRAEVGQLIGPANASADAQNYGGGVGIQNVRRGVARASVGNGSDITVSATTLSALQRDLSLSMTLSGRPLEVGLSGIAKAGSGGLLVLDVLLRGVSVSGVVNGIYYTEATFNQGFSVSETVLEPAAGPATLQVVGRIVTANATVYADANSQLVLTAKEL